MSDCKPANKTMYYLPVDRSKGRQRHFQVSELKGSDADWMFKLESRTTDPYSETHVLCRTEPAVLERTQVRVLEIDGKPVSSPTYLTLPNRAVDALARQLRKR